MDTRALVGLLKRVIFSWEVPAVTVALVLYLSLVFYVGRLNRPPRPAPAPRKRRPAKPAIAAVVKGEGEEEE